MGFCSDDQYREFLKRTPIAEKFIVDSGVRLIKYWLEVSNEEQAKRFAARITDPRRQWKLSPMDLPSREKWYEYSRARDRMLEATDTSHAPWHLVRSDDKKTARLNLISHLLKAIPYQHLKPNKIKLPHSSKKHAYDDDKAIAKRRFIPEKY
jgi:polyphosphate kinase 2 (PPK2 family)